MEILKIHSEILDKLRNDSNTTIFNKSKTEYIITFKYMAEEFQHYGIYECQEFIDDLEKHFKYSVEEKIIVSIKTLLEIDDSTLKKLLNTSDYLLYFYSFPPKEKRKRLTEWKSLYKVSYSISIVVSNRKEKIEKYLLQ